MAENRLYFAEISDVVTLPFNQKVKNVQIVIFISISD